MTHDAAIRNPAKCDVSRQNGGAGCQPHNAVDRTGLDFSVALTSPPRDPEGKSQGATPRMIPHYVVRHLAGQREELSCLPQLEDESAAMYFNIVHGRRACRRFTTQGSGKRCAEYVLIARQTRTDGRVEEREIALYNAPNEFR